MKWHVEGGSLHGAGRGQQALRGILQHQGVGADAIERQFFLVDGDGDFLALLAHDADITHLWNGTQTVGEVVGVFMHLAVGLVGRFHGDEQR